MQLLVKLASWPRIFALPILSCLLHTNKNLQTAWGIHCAAHGPGTTHSNWSTAILSRVVQVNITKDQDYVVQYHDFLLHRVVLTLLPLEGPLLSRQTRVASRPLA